MRFSAAEPIAIGTEPEQNDAEPSAYFAVVRDGSLHYFGNVGDGQEAVLFAQRRRLRCGRVVRVVGALFDEIVRQHAQLVRYVVHGGFFFVSGGHSFVCVRRVCCGFSGSHTRSLVVCAFG